MTVGATSKQPDAYQCFRISPRDSNRLAIIFDPTGESTPFIACVEIFDEGGKTPPNMHRSAFEMFYVLEGHARACCGADSLELSRGDSLLVPPGSSHVIENIGEGRLYTLTTMVPNENFAELIRSGTPAPLDAQDMEVLVGLRGEQR